MSLTFTPEERLMFLTIMLGGANRLLGRVYRESDPENQARILDAMAEYNQEIEPVMDMYGLDRTPEGLARAMIMTEDLIGCEPQGRLERVSETEAVRKVTQCPWTESFDGDLCRLQMKAMEMGVGRAHGLAVVCEQTMADGAEYCIWKVTKQD